MKWIAACSFTLVAMMMALLSGTACSAAAQSVTVNIGRSVAVVNGPWKFHIGDRPEWAESAFDDSAWETVDLTPAPGAHDSDVGLTSYVSGWNSKGHAGYIGFAWYRIRIDLSAAAGESLALLGPAAVDSTYQVFADGQLLGAAGDFSRPIPVAYSIQPRVFPLPELSNTASGGTSILLAFRIWMGPWESGDPTAGGIHIAPSIGATDGIDARYRLQWLQTVSGYIVEVVEALLFVLLALMACSLVPLDRAKAAYRSIAVALLLTAIFRANQAFFYWTQFESVQDFELLVPVLLIPLIMCMWLLAWSAWVDSPHRNAIRRIAVALTLIYIGAQFCSGSWFYEVFSHAIRDGLHLTIKGVRLVFLLGLSYVCISGLRLQGREGWLAFAAALLISIGLFAQELSSIGFRGIWFPFGTGVSRTQFAYAAFDLVLFVLLLRELYRPRPNIIIKSRT